MLTFFLIDFLLRLILHNSNYVFLLLNLLILTFLSLTFFYVLILHNPNYAFFIYIFSEKYPTGFLHLHISHLLIFVKFSIILNMFLLTYPFINIYAGFSLSRSFIHLATPRIVFYFIYLISQVAFFLKYLKNILISTCLVYRIICIICCFISMYHCMFILSLFLIFLF